MHLPNQERLVHSGHRVDCLFVQQQSSSGDNWKTVIVWGEVKTVIVGVEIVNRRRL